MKKEFKELNFEKKINKCRKVNTILICIATIISIITTPVYAAEDPLSVINNLSNFIFEIVQAVGVIMILFGLVQFGLALKSQDPTQRASSIFTIVGGLVIAFAKVILNSIMG